MLKSDKITKVSLPMELDRTPEFTHALALMEETERSLFITGRAGTGKSTLLTYFRETTTKRIAVLAPTGVAALNVKGQTVHSFFKFKSTVTLQSIKKPTKKDPESLYANLDAIIIDEISMVRADVLDCVEKFLRFRGKDPQKPFGGIQMIFIGDLYQLPPVVMSKEREIFETHYKSPYFFSAHSFEHLNMELIELEKIYRQQDPRFIALLNAIRNKIITDADIHLLNQRLVPDFEPQDDTCFVYLTPMNQEADRINTQKLQQLKASSFTYEAKIKGDFGKENYPTLERLTLKIGAQVMLINNDPLGRWVNGTMGKVLDILFEREHELPLVKTKLDNGTTVMIEPHKWEISTFYLEEDRIRAKVMGSFTQYPLALAWAITIHKSQGKTFHNVILDIGKGAFSPGQVYVALSRCTSYEGLVLLKPILKKHIWLNYEIVKFVTEFQYGQSEQRLSLEDKIKLIQKAIEENKKIEVVYLRANNEKSRRTITPHKVGELSYQGIPYLGFKGYCHVSQEERSFRVDRILEFTC